ncbi:uncharacterized protein RJT21DRAFT_13157 [Scheffersomyces amazonensis]|uniref:uncharacterized protein n=1 Tax=Scheffersomyces amazonensis TaxID=1078765 RepID=UPI00315D999D
MATMLKENNIISKALLTIDQYKGNLNNLKSSVLDNEYTPLNCPKYFSRTLIWKCCLITDSLSIHNWYTKLHDSRIIYHQLTKRNDMIIPWWVLDPESPFFQSKELSIHNKSNIKRTNSRTSRSTTTTTTNSVSINKIPLTRVSNIDDPLRSPNRSPVRSTRSPTPSLPYQITEEDIELLQIIVLDIERLFPGEQFYQSTNSITHKRHLIEILYVWSRCNPQVGYKQGIHEILGLFYKNLYQESIEIPRTNTISSDDVKILNLYDINYLNHDLFTIFNKFILTSGIISKFYESEEVLWKTIETFNVYLMKVDQLIHYNLLNKLKLESQLWIIRYFRLILLRELGNDLETTTLLWDKLIASPQIHSYGGIPELLMFMIIQLLIQLKTNLITCDFSESLSLLLHYPIQSHLHNQLTRHEFIGNLIKDSLKLYERKANDLKLYEYGLKLNNIYNPNLRITMSYSGSARNSGEISATSSAPVSRSPTPLASNNTSNNSHNSHNNTSSSINHKHPDPKAEQLKFEKLRLEMRLKKKAQSMLR